MGTTSTFSSIRLKPLWTPEPQLPSYRKLIDENNGSHDVIIGIDFLKASQAVLDCGRDELIFDELLHDEEIDPHGMKLYVMSVMCLPLEVHLSKHQRELEV
ncbi:hypothetical protein TNCV_625841 [Trichonephila clavipes]|nr:hypothetical protein TNCV_625841 [Trichonephila clavipes]